MHVERVGPYLWRIPQDARRGMRVPGLVVADETLMTAIRTDASLEQVANGATLPGIVKASLAMPDPGPRDATRSPRRCPRPTRTCARSSTSCIALEFRHAWRV